MSEATDLRVGGTTMTANFASSEDAYWTFFKDFYTKDADVSIGVMGYPHLHSTGGGRSLARRRAI